MQGGEKGSAEDIFLCNSDDIASILKIVEQERGISVAELARRIGSDRKRLWYVLNGQREMRVDEFLKLCVALEVDPRSFITRGMVDSVMTATKKGSE